MGWIIAIVATGLLLLIQWLVVRRTRIEPFGRGITWWWGGPC
jgi:hypothetical protein